MLEVSIVIPLYNESKNVTRLVEEVLEHTHSATDHFEVILVDDGSADDTWSQIMAASEHHKTVMGIRLSRNFGHQNALLAGLHSAKGQAVISMDGDLQHPPSKIPELIACWRSGSKVVQTRRGQTEHLSFFKRATSNWFYAVFSWLSGVKMEPGSSDFRLLDRQVLQEVIQFHDVNPFLRGAVRWLGFEEQTQTIDYAVGQRQEGESSYTLRRMMKFANAAVVSFSTKPLIAGIWFGLATGALAFLELIYIVYQYFQGNTVPGWASTIGIISLLFGILFVLLGVIGLYLARIHTALQGRPKFVIDSVTSDTGEDSVR